MSATTTAASEAAESFDQIVKELQSIVDRLEKGDLPLEQSLIAFERGVVLSRKGQDVLDAAEKRVERLLKDGSTQAIQTAAPNGCADGQM